MNTKEQWQEELDNFGAVFSFPHSAMNVKAEIKQRDGFPMIYNGIYINKDLSDFIRETREQAEKHGYTTGFIDGQILGKKEVIENITPMLSPGQIKYLEDFLSE